MPPHEPYDFSDDPQVTGNPSPSKGVGYVILIVLGAVFAAATLIPYPETSTPAQPAKAESAASAPAPKP